MQHAEAQWYGSERVTGRPSLPACSARSRCARGNQITLRWTLGYRMAIRVVLSSQLGRGGSCRRGLVYGSLKPAGRRFAAYALSIEGYLRIVDSSAARQRNLILIQEGGRTRARSLSKYHATTTEICALKHIGSCGTATFGALPHLGTTL
jgi:hypothetical protein